MSPSSLLLAALLHIEASREGLIQNVTLRIVMMSVHIVTIGVHRSS